MLTSVGVSGIAGAAGSTLDVCPSGCAYTSIQDAIDDAGTDDTVSVQAGTYTEVLSIPASKAGLTLSGAGDDLVTVDASASSSYGLDIQADDVTVEGLTIVGPSDGFYGIHAADTPEDLTGLTVQETTIRESASTELDLHAVTDATIRNVTLRGAGTGGNGLAVTDSHDVTVEDITTSGNTWGGFAIYTSGKFVEAGTSGITLTGTNSIAEANPVYIQIHEAAVSNLDIQGYPVELTYGNNPDFTFLQPSVTDALDAAVAFVASDRFDVDTAVVEDTRDGVLHVGDGMRVQAAVDAADVGDEILVHGGTYDESVSLPTDDLTLAAEDEATVTGTVTVDADGIEIVDLHVADAGLRGIVVDGSHEDLTLAGIEISGTLNGLWVGGTSGVDGLTVVDSTFEENRIAIYFQNDPNFVNDASDLGAVEDVLIRDTVMVDQLRKGLYAETLSDAVLDNVTVSGITSDTYGFNNGIDINLKAGDYSDILIQDSTIEGVSMGDPGNQWTGYVPAFSSAVAIKARDDPGSYDTHPATLHDVRIDNVVVRDSFNGLRVGEPGVDYDTNDAPTGVSIHESTFVDLDGFGLSNVGNAVVDAAHNWWGSSAGPTLNETTAELTGESVHGPVDFAPFCLVEDCSINAAVHGSPAPHVSAGSPVSDALE